MEEPLYQQCAQEPKHAGSLKKQKTEQVRRRKRASVESTSGGVRSGPLPAVMVRLGAENLPALGAPPLEHRSSGGRPHPPAEPVGPSERFPGPAPLRQAERRLPGPHLKAPPLLCQRPAEAQIQAQREACDCSVSSQWTAFSKKNYSISRQSRMI